jgi:hypothetical protein
MYYVYFVNARYHNINNIPIVLNGVISLNFPIIDGKPYNDFLYVFMKECNVPDYVSNNNLIVESLSLLHKLNENNEVI